MSIPLHIVEPSTSSHSRTLAPLPRRSGVAIGIVIVAFTLASMTAHAQSIRVTMTYEGGVDPQPVDAALDTDQGEGPLWILPHPQSLPRMIVAWTEVLVIALPLGDAPGWEVERGAEQTLNLTTVTALDGVAVTSVGARLRVVNDLTHRVRLLVGSEVEAVLDVGEEARVFRDQVGQVGVHQVGVQPVAPGPDGEQTPVFDGPPGEFSWSLVVSDRRWLRGQAEPLGLDSAVVEFQGDWADREIPRTWALWLWVAGDAHCDWVQLAELALTTEARSVAEGWQMRSVVIPDGVLDPLTEAR